MSVRSQLNEFAAWSVRKSFTAYDSVTGGVPVDLLGGDFLTNPYPYYDRLRADKMRRSHVVNGWWLVDFEGVQHVLSNSDIYSADPSQFDGFAKKRQQRAVKQAKLLNLHDESSDSQNMLSSDPPDHSRLRRLVTRGFTTKLLTDLAPFVEATAQRCVERADGNIFEVVGQLAEPLPALVIAEMLGVPAEDQEQFRVWSAAQIANSGFTAKPGAELAAMQASYDLAQYFRKLINDRPAGNNNDDLLSRLLAAERDDVLDENEVIATAVLILIAGHETTTRLIGNALYVLLQHPEQLADLRQAPDELLDNTIEECLRYESPVQTTARTVVSDHSFNGYDLKRGQTILTFVGAANRDPQVNADPNQFDIHRESIKQISFGYGIHLCVGAALARLETKIALRTLLDRFPTMALVNDNPDWSMDPIFRGHNSLPLRV
jgi:pimeloyl-[acyl-carrier protein] synthase